MSTIIILDQPEYIWLFFGFLMIVGTILTALIISKISHPIFVVRYIYPLCSVFWLMIAFALSKVRIYKIVIYFLVIVIFFTSGYSYLIKDIKSNKRIDEKNNITWQFIKPFLDDVKYIYYIDVSHMNTNLGKYYFPRQKKEKIVWNKRYEILNDEIGTKQTILFVNHRNVNKYKKEFDIFQKNNKVNIKCVYKDALIGDRYNVDIFVLQKNEMIE